MIKTFFTDPLPPPTKLKLVLKGEVERIWGSKSGIYKLQPKVVNGYPHWIQKSESTSLWFKKSESNSLWFDAKYCRWIVGMSSNLGESISAIKGPKPDDDWPQNLCGNWKYFDYDKDAWMDAGENVVFELVI